MSMFYYIVSVFSPSWDGDGCEGNVTLYEGSDRCRAIGAWHEACADIGPSLEVIVLGRENEHYDRKEEKMRLLEELYEEDNEFIETSMEDKIVLDNHFVAEFCDVGENQLWLCAHYYEDTANLDEGPDWGCSSDWHNTLQDAIAYVCNSIEQDYGRDLALEFCDILGEKLMFDELPRHWTAFAFK